MRRSAIALTALLATLSTAPTAEAQESLPGPLQEVRFDQRLGESLPLDLSFLDHQGRTVKLGDYFGERPVVLALVYYECPMLCTLVLNGLTSTLRAMDFEPGSEFDVLAISFDPGETPELAAEKRLAYLQRYDRADTEAGWHFLTGSQEAIERLTESVGFSYVYDEAIDQYAHAAGIVVITPEGRIARYLYGIEYAPRDLRLALVEATDNKIGNLVDQVLLYCFHYDPVVGKYSAVVMNLVRLAGLVTLALLGGFVALMWRRDRRTAASEA